MFELGIPLHPATVHVPLGLAVVLPPLVLWAAYRTFKGGETRALWGTIVFIQLVLVGAAFYAMSAGEHDEEIVEEVVSGRRIHAHETMGKQFAWTGLASLACTVLLIGASGAPARALAVIAVLLSIGTGGLAARAGHSGGKLVYVYGAASAHVNAARQAGTGAPGGGARAPAGETPREHDETSEHGDEH